MLALVKLFFGYLTHFLVFHTGCLLGSQKMTVVTVGFSIELQWNVFIKKKQEKSETKTKRASQIIDTAASQVCWNKFALMRFVKTAGNAKIVFFRNTILISLENLEMEKNHYLQRKVMRIMIFVLYFSPRLQSITYILAPPHLCSGVSRQAIYVLLHWIEWGAILIREGPNGRKKTWGPRTKDKISRKSIFKKK